jgi:hypothetical protein
MMQGPKLHHVLICLVVVVYFGDFGDVAFEIGSTKRKKRAATRCVYLRSNSLVLVIILISCSRLCSISSLFKVHMRIFVNG